MNVQTLGTRRPGNTEAKITGEWVGFLVERGICDGFKATATRVSQLVDPRRIDIVTTMWSFSSIRAMLIGK